MQTIDLYSALKRDPDYLDAHMTEQEAAKFLGLSVRTLQKWRVQQLGPRFLKLSSRAVRYRRRELIAWGEARLVASTSHIT